MGRKVLVCCDDTPHSRVMVDVAFSQIWRPADEVHLATVLPPVSSAPGYPLAMSASSAAVVAVHHSVEAQRHVEAERGKETLRLVADLLVIDYKVARDNIHFHVLPSEGGASGVSAALLRLIKDEGVDLVVVGNRGLGAIKRSLMSLVGLGSVSDAVVQAAPCPVLLVRWQATGKSHAAHAEAEAPPVITPASKPVMVGVDESPPATAALLWALDNVLGPHDYLHIVSVAVSTPAPVLDEPAAAAAMQAQLAADQLEAATSAAHVIVDRAVDLAVSRGVTRTKIVSAVLSPAGGSSDAGGAMATYSHDKHVDVVVVGSRGMGSLQGRLMSFLGLGSVSQHLAHSLHCVLVVVKDQPEQSQLGPSASENITFKVIPEAEETEAGDS